MAETVVGVGNAARGDDAVGPAVAEALRRRRPAGLRIATAAPDVGELLEHLAGARALWLVDAAASGAAAGTLHRFDAAGAPLPANVAAPGSSHALGVAEALELARALGVLPPRCVVYAVEGACFDLGAGLSPAVADAVDRVAARILAEVTEVARARAQPLAR